MSAARQWQADAAGGPEVLRLRSAPIFEPGPGEVAVDIRAVGVNPADAKRLAAGPPGRREPLTLGFEAAGVVRVLGAGSRIGDGTAGVGSEVVVYPRADAYATALVVSAEDVTSKPAGLSFAEAASLLLVGTTAAELLDLAAVGRGDTVLVHGAAGAVGTSVLQQARELEARVIGTASPADFARVRSFGARPVAYGEGMLKRLIDAVPDGVDAAIDTVGVAEAIDVSLVLVADRGRIVTTAAFARAAADGFAAVGARNPRSGPFRRAVRERILTLAASKRLTVPIAAAYPFHEAPRALTDLIKPHASGKFVLIVSAD